MSTRGNEKVEQYLKPDLRFPFGLIFEYKLKNNFYLATNLNYELKGVHGRRLEITDELGNNLGMGTIQTRIGYITIPLLAGRDFGSKTIFKAQLGRFIGIRTSARSIARLDNGTKSEWNNIVYYESLDFSVSIGAGVSIPLNARLRAGFQVCNNLGLANISRLQVAGNGSIKTNSVNGMLNLVYTK